MLGAVAASPAAYLLILIGARGVEVRVVGPRRTSASPSEHEDGATRVTHCVPSVRAGRILREDLLPRVIRDADNSWKQVFPRSEEHTSELQSRPHLVCRLLLEKKK